MQKLTSEVSGWAEKVDNLRGLGDKLKASYSREDASRIRDTIEDASSKVELLRSRYWACTLDA